MRHERSVSHPPRPCGTPKCLDGLSCARRPMASVGAPKRSFGAYPGNAGPSATPAHAKEK
jgi:hypothetical protein